MSPFKIRHLLYSIPVGLLLLFSLPAQAVSFDSSSSAIATNTNTLSFNIQVANNSNKKLIVGISIEEIGGTESVSSVTYSGNPLTLAASQSVVSSGNLQRVEFWYLDDPQNGNRTIQVTTTGNVNNLSAGAISLFDAQTGALVNQTNTATNSNSISTSITTTATNTWLLDVVGSGDQRSFTQNSTQGVNQTERLDRTNASSSFAISTLEMPTTGTTTITQTPNSNANRLAHIVLAVAPFGAGGGGGSCVSFKDQFDTVNYNNSDGTIDWSTNSWIESNDNDNASTGNIRISGGELQLIGSGVNPDPSVERQADLSSYDSATLKFDYRETGTWEGSDTVRIETSTNGGATWSTLYTFSDDQAPSSFSQAIPSFKSNNFRVRFNAGSSWSGEVFYLDNVEIEACTTIDNTPPTISSVTASCPGLNQVTVTFSENVELASATNIANYSLDNGATVTAASLSGNTVTLTTSALTDLTSYTLTVNNVNDLAGNTIVANSTSTFTANCTNLIAQYRLDEETWNGTAGEVKDFLGAYDGTAVGVASPINPGKVCNAAYIPYDDNDVDQYAVDTGIDINSIGTNGNTGSINFWYQSDTPWQGGGDRVLFDASTLAGKYFYLLILDDGRLRFSLEDDADRDLRFNTTQAQTFTASDWVHIGVTWDLTQAGLGTNYDFKIYINGVEKTLTGYSGPPATTTGTLGDMNTLYFGDNRTTYHPGGTANSAQGRIDEIYIYKTAINQAQMQTDMNATHTCTAVACSYRDDFTTSSFANNDGSINWAGNWTEIDSIAGTGPASGYVYISGGDLNLQNNNPTNTAMGPGVERGFDLTGATDATITYTYKLTGGVDTNDDALVRISDDDGASWTTIESITNKTDGVYTSSIALSSFPAISLTNTMKISLRIRANSNEYRNGSETLSFLYLSIYPAGMCTPGTLNHIRIEHDGEGLTCDGEQVIVRACVDVSCSAEYSNSVTATLSPDGDTVTFTGNTTGNVHQSTAGTFTLSANTISPVPTNGVRCFVGATETCNIDFVNSGFRFTDGANPPNPITIGTQIAGKASSVAPGDQVIALQAVRTDTTTGSCVGVFPNGADVNVEMASQCNNPTTCITASEVSITNNSITTAINNNPDAAVTSYTSVPLRFTSNSQALLNFAYPDVGQISLYARYNIPDSSGTPTGNYMSGSSNLFVVKPAGFVIISILRSDDSANPANTAATDTPYFVKAGTNFKATIEARDINGNITPNYGNETDPEGILLTPALVAIPGLTNNPAITNGTISGNEFGSTGAVNDANGVATVINLSWPEVGIITLTPSVAGTDDNDYLGAGSVTGTTTGNVGRFTPNHFDVVSTESCTPGAPATDFTYSAQGFTVNVTARNSAGGTTVNYDGDFVRDPEISNAGDTTSFTNNTLSNTYFTTNNGIGTRNDVTYTFGSKETIPLAMTNIRAIDADTISSATYAEGSNLFRSGRARLENVYGPELTSLTMQLKVEYYSDNSTPLDLTDDGFILNTDDSCTTYDATAGSLTNYTGNLTSGDTTVTGASAIAAGLANITFSAPGAGNEGSVNLLADNVSSWLTYTWNVDCDNADADDDITTGIDVGMCGPFGTASFGLYRGDDRIIYWREVF